MLDWNLLGAPVDVAGSVQKGFDLGRRQRAQRMLAENPDDPRAIAALREIDPALAAAAEAQSIHRGDIQRQTQARSAFSDYLLAGRPRASSFPATAPAQAAFPSQATTEPVRSQASALPRPEIVHRSQMPTGEVPSAFGAPTAPAPVGPAAAPVVDPQQEAFERLARIDPAAAVAARENHLKHVSEQLKVAETLNEGAMRLIGGVYDQASYDAAKQSAARMYTQYGHDPSEILASLPPEYSPEAMDALQLRALDNKSQLAELRARHKLNWDIEDDEIDNDRADENLESLTGYREGALSNTRRGQDLTDRRGRRGQDLAHDDRTRGQDLSHDDRVRGQDLTDKRGRRGQDMTDKRGRGAYSYSHGGGRGRGGGGGGSLRQQLQGKVVGGVAVSPNEPIATLADGSPAVVRGGKWVKAQ